MVRQHLVCLRLLRPTQIIAVPLISTRQRLFLVYKQGFIPRHSPLRLRVLTLAQPFGTP